MCAESGVVAGMGGQEVRVNRARVSRRYWDKQLVQNPSTLVHLLRYATEDGGRRAVSFDNPEDAAYIAHMLKHHVSLRPGEEALIMEHEEGGFWCVGARGVADDERLTRLSALAGIACESFYFGGPSGAFEQFYGEKAAKIRRLRLPLAVLVPINEKGAGA